MSLLETLMLWRTKRANPRSSPADLIFDAAQPIAKTVDDHERRITAIEKRLEFGSDKPGPAGDA